MGNLIHRVFAFAAGKLAIHFPRCCKWLCHHLMTVWCIGLLEKFFNLLCLYYHLFLYLSPIYLCLKWSHLHFQVPRLKGGPSPNIISIASSPSDLWGGSKNGKQEFPALGILLRNKWYDGAYVLLTTISRLLTDEVPYNELYLATLLASFMSFMFLNVFEIALGKKCWENVHFILHLFGSKVTQSSSKSSVSFTKDFNL